MGAIKRVILGLDPSLTRTGYCVLGEVDGEKPFLFDIGTIEPPPWARIHLETMIYVQERLDRLLSGALSVYAMTQCGEIKHVACEGAVFGGGDAVAQLYALQMFAQRAFLERRAKVVYLAPSAWRSVAHGWQDPGASSVRKRWKEDALQLCKAETGLKKLNSDMADAWAIARTGLRFFAALEGSATLTKSEEFIFKRIRVPNRGILKGSPVKEGLAFKKDRLWFDFGESVWASPHSTRCTRRTSKEASSTSPTMST